MMSVVLFPAKVWCTTKRQPYEPSCHHAIYYTVRDQLYSCKMRCTTFMSSVRLRHAPSRDMSLQISTYDASLAGLGPVRETDCHAQHQPEIKMWFDAKMWNLSAVRHHSFKIWWKWKNIAALPKNKNDFLSFFFQKPCCKCHHAHCVMHDI